ncbi:hypothetical protein EJ06DRAFT_93285 [Trichodelitschia bisporula]|uniref:Uncharacterized protein n=1 Tax=Trichodelitschia bisporula TaxID=703511 RepID=A0A6G1HT00_9PEZI|nr:hypothetical protein EJ06DRAFT_93285 [Trichodelitschia bisporula]
MAWEFLRPILTPNALATVQARPMLLAYFLAGLGGMISIICLAFYISFETGKAYRKPKTDAKGGAPARGPPPATGFKGFVGRVRGVMRV